MAYSKNPVTLERMRAYLTPLLASPSLTWKTKPGEAPGFAYKLREARRIAKALDDPIGRVDVIIKVVADNEVWAVPPYEHSSRITVGVEIIERTELSVARPQALVDTRQITQGAWLEEIQEIWARRDGDRIYLPKAWPTEGQLEELYAWASPERIMIFENDGAVTLVATEGNEELADFAWSPES